MTEFRDLSRLPVDQAYWDDLEARILSGLPPRAEARRDAWSPLAARAWPLSALAAAAAIAALLLMPARATVPPSLSLGLLSVPQDEPLVDAILSAPTPPSLGGFFNVPTERRQ